jgi:hypothetical protein
MHIGLQLSAWLLCCLGVVLHGCAVHHEQLMVRSITDLGRRDGGAGRDLAHGGLVHDVPKSFEFPSRVHAR